MKTLLKLLPLLLLLGTGACHKDIYGEDVGAVTGDLPVNPNHPLRDSLAAIVQKNLNKGLPGMQVMVKSPDGWTVVNGGYAKIENQTPWRDNATAWLYSITKTYMATLLVKAQERGQIDLDDPINRYLSDDIAKNLPQSDRITVRQLLSHTSGYVNFTITPGYFLNELNQPLNQPDLEDQLAFMYGKPLLFEPGTDYFYSNTNFLLAQFILERVTGKPWGEQLYADILTPLGLNQSYYPVTDAQILQLGFPNYYFERFNNGELENCTGWHNAIAHSLNGYGGIAANGADVIRFYEALMNGQVVNQTSLDEMRQWVQGKQSTEPDYGLGMEYYEYIKGVPTYGHEGDNIGGTTQILYIPSKQIYVFITINAGRQLYGQYLFKTSDAKIEVCRFLSR